MKSAKAGLDAIGFEANGDDPDPYLELPDGVEPETFSTHNLDALGTAYQLDHDGTEWRAVLLVVADGATCEEAREKLLTRLADVGEDLLGIDEDDDQGDDGDDDDPPPELPPGPPIDVPHRVKSREREPVPVARRKK